MRHLLEKANQYIKYLRIGFESFETLNVNFHRIMRLKMNYLVLIKRCVRKIGALAFSDS